MSNQTERETQRGEDKGKGGDDIFFFVGRSLEEMEGKEDWGGEVNLRVVGSGCTCLCNAMATREQG